MLHALVFLLLASDSLIKPEIFVADAPLQEASLPSAESAEPSPKVRFFMLQMLGMYGSLSSTGEARFREINGCYLRGSADCTDRSPFLTGTGTRSTPSLLMISLFDFELGVVIAERVRVAATVAFQLLPQEGHAFVGYDFPHVLNTRPDTFGTFTLWLGGGYAHVNPLSMGEGTNLYGGVATVRATFEYKRGAFIVRPELYTRVQFVSRYDEENTGEGYYRTFTSPLPTVQIGFRLGFGFSLPR